MTLISKLKGPSQALVQSRELCPALMYVMKTKIQPPLQTEQKIIIMKTLESFSTSQIGRNCLFRGQERERNQFCIQFFCCVLYKVIEIMTKIPFKSLSLLVSYLDLTQSGDLTLMKYRMRQRMIYIM